MYLTHPVSESIRLLDSASPPTPSPGALARVEAVWERLRRSNPKLFNGRVFSLDRFQDGDAVGFLAEYKWYLAQLEEPALQDELTVRSLAVSGVVIVSGHVIFGLRRSDLAVEGGLWETVPTGTVSGAAREADGSVSWRGVFLEELREELGLELGMDLPECAPRPFALVENTDTRIWELGVALELPPGISMDYREVLAAWTASPAPEHSELAAVPVADVPRFLKARADRMVGATPYLAAAYGLAPLPG